MNDETFPITVALERVEAAAREALRPPPLTVEAEAEAIRAEGDAIAREALALLARTRLLEARVEALAHRKALQ